MDIVSLKITHIQMQNFSSVLTTYKPRENMIWLEISHSNALTTHQIK